MKTRKIIAVLLVLALVASFCAACKSTPAPAQEASGSAEQATAAPAEEATTAPAEKIKLAWYFPVPHPYGEAVKAGVEQFAKDYADSVEVTMKIGTSTTPVEEQQNIEGLVALGYKYISMFSADTVSVNTLAEEMDPLGVNIGLFGGGAQQPTKTRFVVATDLKESARLATQALIDSLGGTGNILVIYEGVGGSSIPRKEGVEEALAANPSITVLQEVITSADGVTTAEVAQEKIQSALSAHTNQVDGMVCVGFN
ncbi:MAG: substrate-binding domain-containing protein, partial [Clostridiales bacterium]|nr:substrate-binding domain-containing protein [Clostridiales bacterium]